MSESLRNVYKIIIRSSITSRLYNQLPFVSDVFAIRVAVDASAAYFLQPLSPCLDNFGT